MRERARVSLFYIEVPYRTLSRPAITLWEHKLARKRLREQRRAAVDEDGLFAAIDEMREIEREAGVLTRTARRNRTRRKTGQDSAGGTPQAGPQIPATDAGPARPFDDIEPW